MIRPKTSYPHRNAENRARRDDFRYFAEHTLCPVCGKEAAAKYFDDTAKKWTYRHPGKRFEASSYCKADS